jgi:hypothetical protein
MWSRHSVTAVVALCAALLGSPAFSAPDPLRFQLSAPFTELFDGARDDENYTVAGELALGSGEGAATYDVTIGVRGNTSRRESECAFPKLKITLPAGAPDIPLFGGKKSLKVGTHCGEAPKGKLTQRFGRLANQQSPLRETFVYSLLEAFAVPALKARRAVITYVDADATADRARTIERNAFLLEDSDDAIERLGGRGEIHEREFTTAQERFTPADTLAVAFAQASIGNFDWCLKMTADDRYRCDRRHPVWNIAVADLGEGKARPLLYDFDVSGIVTGSHPWFADVFNAAFVPSHSQIEVEVLAQVQRTRTLFTRAELDRARAAFVARKSRAFETLEDASLDPDGRRIARAYLDAFFAAIESDEAFYRPVVVAAGTKAFANSTRRLACPAAATVPPGTPVSDPMATDGPLVQVLLLDALWHWAPPAQCKGIRGPVWIEADAIGREFPAK